MDVACCVSSLYAEHLRIFSRFTNVQPECEKKIKVQTQGQKNGQTDGVLKCGGIRTENASPFNIEFALITKSLHCEQIDFSRIQWPKK